MAKSSDVKTTLGDAAKAKTVWQAHPDFKIGQIGFPEFTAVLEAAEGLARDYASKSVALTGTRISRDDKMHELNDLVSRFRSGVRAAYGSDSVQYEQAGAVRKSARRKSPKVRTTTAATDVKVA
jgi:hypothetical protein